MTKADLIERVAKRKDVPRELTKKAVAQVLDAIFTWAGLTSLMSNGAHAAASHAIYEGFTFCDKTRDFGHGLLVGFTELPRPFPPLHVLQPTINPLEAHTNPIAVH